MAAPKKLREVEAATVVHVHPVLQGHFYSTTFKISSFDFRLQVKSDKLAKLIISTRLSCGSFIENVEGEPGHKLPELLLAGVVTHRAQAAGKI